MKARLLCLVLCLSACRSGDTPPAPAPAAPAAPAALAPPTAASTSPAPEADAGAATPSAEVPVTPAEREAVARGLAQMKAGSEGWYGVYVMGKKVGHGRMAFRASKPDEAGLVTSEFEMRMNVTGGGNANSIHITERRSYGADWPHALVLSRFEQDANGFVEVREGKPAPDGMHISRTIDGKAEPVRIAPVTRETLVDALRSSPLELSGLVYGKAVTAATWDWEKERDETLTVTPEREETRRRAGIDEKVAVLTVRYASSGVTATTIVGGSGEVLEMTLGAAVTMKLEEKDVAQSGAVGLDVMGSGVKSPVALGDPTRADRLVFELTTLGAVEVPSSAAQKVERLGDNRLRVTRVRGPGDPVLPDDAKAALAPDATMDADHPSIKAALATLVKDGMTPIEKVKAVAAFVYQTLDKKLATHLPTASRVLEAKVGDCTEHTWLTIALLRAAGVPARPVYGLAYAGDGEQTFAYHAWVEVALDGHWVWVDPTWDEAVADATHLGFGSDLGGVAPSLGAITIDRVGP